MENPIASQSRRRHSWAAGTFKAAVVVMAIAVVVTWAGSAYDHPVDDAIVAGMDSSQCSSVRAMKPGSLLTSMPPDDGICHAFFLYRGSASNAPDNEAAYRTSVTQARRDEFRQLFVYVWLLTTVVGGVGYGLFASGRGIWRRLSPSRHTPKERH